MNLDRNKTELTKDVTAAAALYLEERGIKPIETEVPICAGWVADLAGMLAPTRTELISLKLLRPRPDWQEHGEYDKWRQELDAVPLLLTVLVEVKTSRSDFMGDKKWTAAAQANLSYIAIPKDLNVDRAEWPDGWGVLSVPVQGYIHCLRPPKLSAITHEQQLGVVYAVAVRRDHHTRYERLREFQREQRIRQNDDKTLTRMSTCMNAVCGIATGRHATVKEALEYHGIKNLPQGTIDHLQMLWDIRQKKVTV